MIIRRYSSRKLFILVAVAILLSGCGKPTDVPPIPTPSPAETAISVEDTPQPTAVPAKLLLVDPADLISAEVDAYLSSFTTENGLQLEKVTTPEIPAQGAETKIVVFLAAPPNLAEVVSASPDTQFIVNGAVDIQPLPNLSIIQTRTDDLVFMAGYLTMQISWDWRTAALIPNDVVHAAEKVNAFENGARYVCGQCTPYYAPIVYFPLLAQETMNASIEAWDVQITTLAQHFVNSYFVDPSMATPEILDRLLGLSDDIYNDVYLVGLGTSPVEQFTALVNFDILPALQQLMPQALAGTGGVETTALVRIVLNRDETVVTPAKVENFNRVAQDLAAGIIIPLSIP